MKFKLNIELVPDGCWHSNLRTILSKKQWDFLKSDAKRRANNRCMICGKQTDKLDAHERWSYDGVCGVQKLEDIIAVCKDCHSVMHINFTYLKGDAVKAENHFIKVNNCTYAEFKRALGEANERQKELNEVSEWTIDLTYLNRYVDGD